MAASRNPTDDKLLAARRRVRRLQAQLKDMASDDPGRAKVEAELSEAVAVDGDMQRRRSDHLMAQDPGGEVAP